VGSRANLLTQREIEVLELVAQGMTNKQIASTLYISVNTVRNHLVRISRRLDACSRTQVVARARLAGLIG
jgi:DNA-binding NarL/FixJ family response regulator